MLNDNGVNCFLCFAFPFHFVAAVCVCVRLCIGSVEPHKNSRRRERLRNNSKRRMANAYRKRKTTLLAYTLYLHCWVRDRRRTEVVLQIFCRFALKRTHGAGGRRSQRKRDVETMISFRMCTRLSQMPMKFNALNISHNHEKISGRRMTSLRPLSQFWLPLTQSRNWFAIYEEIWWWRIYLLVIGVSFFFG